MEENGWMGLQRLFGHAVSTLNLRHSRVFVSVCRPFSSKVEYFNMGVHGAGPECPFGELEFLSRCHTFFDHRGRVSLKSWHLIMRFRVWAE